MPAKFKAPKFGRLGFARDAGGRHQADPTPLGMPADDTAPYAGGHRREGRHGIGPATKSADRYQSHAGSDFRGQPRPSAPAGQHRKGRAAQPAGRQPPAGPWMPNKSEWRRLVSGETVNGHRLAKSR